MVEVVWTSRPPTRPGYYLWTAGTGGILFAVRVTDDPARGLVADMGHMFASRTPKPVAEVAEDYPHGKWHGPIVLPAG